MSEREQLYDKLYRFYERYDPGRLQHGIDAVVDFGLAEGLAALNQGLMDRYGDYLDSGSNNALDAHSDRSVIRSRIEMFYLKHEPTKLDHPEDIEAITDWCSFNGLDMLSEKVVRKYDEGIEDVQESDILVQLESFYNKHDPSKSPEDIKTVLTWGVVHGFCVLNQKMIAKYGEGLGSTDRQKVRAEIEQKLTAFYTQQDKSKLDPENLEFIIDLALKHGLGNLNTRLQAKYLCNLNTINRARPSNASKRTSGRTSIRQSVRKSLATFSRKSQPAQSVSVEEAEAAVRADVEYQEYLRKLVEVFYAKYDANRLLEEGVTPVLEFALYSGEDELNKKLRKKYGEDLISIDKQFQAIREKLVRFYEKYDPSKLDSEREKDLDTIIGWALVHGEAKLNQTLIKKYDEDLDGSGLRARLKLFYEAHDAKNKKSEKDLDDIVAWVFANSIEQLNKKLKKKYGKSLEDTTFAEENIPPPPPPPGDDSDLPPPPVPSKASKYQSKPPPLPPGPIPSLPDEGDRHNTTSQLEDKLKKFYLKKDASKNNAAQIAKDVKTILENGVDAFNQSLVKVYGESLNSVSRPKTLTRSSSKKAVVTDKV